MTGPAAIFCVGALHWDVIGTAGGAMRPGDDVPGTVRRAPGGVACNVAAALARALPDLAPPALVAAIGEDAAGRALRDACAARGLDCAHVAAWPGAATDSYLAIETPAGLLGAVCDAGTLALAEAVLPDRLAQALAALSGRALVVADGNLGADALGRIAALARQAGADLRLASAAPAKAARLRAAFGPGVTLYLNLAEARALAGEDLADTRAAAARLVALGAGRALVTDGAQPVALADTDGPRHVLRPPPVRPRRVTGAGDALMAAHIAAELRGLAPDAALAAAVRAAARHVAEEKDTIA